MSCSETDSGCFLACKTGANSTPNHSLSDDLSGPPSSAASWPLHPPHLTPLLRVSPPSPRPRLFRPLCPPSLAAWLQLTCGMAHSKHLMEPLLWLQKAISPNHGLLMPLTPGFYTHTHACGQMHKTHTHTFCLTHTSKHTTKLLFHETTNELTKQGSIQIPAQIKTKL